MDGLAGDLISVLDFQDVKFRYEDGTLALENITLRIERGDRLVILGPNGAGKSTLLKLAAGLLYPNKGKINLFGKELKKKNVRELRKNVGVLFQDPDDQIFMPRVWDDVAFSPINLGYSKEEVKSFVEDALEKAGLSGFDDRVPHHLSYGERKRVAIAGVLAMKPKMLLLDEPTANLDPRGKKELMDIIKNSFDTMVIATHDVNQAVQIANKGIVLNTKVIARGSIGDLFSNIELLKQNNLDVPDISKLFYAIRELGYDVKLPLTQDDALNELKRIISS